MRELNESAIRAYALDCSSKFRAGKFKRVSEEFLQEIEADVEAIIRKLRIQGPEPFHAPLPALDFVTGAMGKKACEILNEVIARVIQNKVMRQPSVGVTLSRTR